jgi:hypothetical protein
MTTPTPEELVELAERAFNAALEIGSDNWDSYLAPARWPQLLDDKDYIAFITALRASQENSRG